MARALRLWLLGVVGLFAGCIEADLDANGYYPCTEQAHCGPGKACALDAPAIYRCYDEDDIPACSPYDSYGCPADQRCVSYLDDGVIECVAAGAAGLDDLCPSASDCGHGLTCVSTTFVDGSVTSRCRELCRTDDDCSPGWACTSEITTHWTHDRWGRTPIGLCERR